MNNDKYLSISAINRYLKHQFDSDSNLQKVYLKGEISNYKNQGRGHLYFSLKDDTSKINVVMFASSASKLLFTPKDGMNVLVRGRISVYENSGSYQIYVDEMLEDGIGSLYIAYEELKNKLNSLGLFSPIHKKKLPAYPKTIGIITAATGAAIKDILTTLRRRYPLAKTILFPSLVQGKQAANDIASNIKMASNYAIDVLIVGRGGGSIEDLWPFNEEIVAHAIFDCEIPIISAVGHDVDWTIADYVADVRAATPTAAAELSVPNIAEIISNITSYQTRLTQVTSQKIRLGYERLNKINKSFVLTNPLNIYAAKEMYLDNLLEKISLIMQNKMTRHYHKYNSLITSYALTNKELNIYPKNQKLDNIINKLEVLNPLNTLKRGYTIVRKENVYFNSIEQIKKDEDLEVVFKDGTIITKVIDITRKEEVK